MGLVRKGRSIARSDKIGDRELGGTVASAQRLSASTSPAGVSDAGVLQADVPETKNF